MLGKSFSPRTVGRWSVASAAGLAALAIGPVTAQAASLPGSSALACLEQRHPAIAQLERFGSHGHWVSTLQADLKELGYFSGSPNGQMGQATVWALERFQRAQGLTPSGVSTPQTWQDILAGLGLTAPYRGPHSALAALAAQHPAMRQVLGPGSRGHWVMTLQADLALAGENGVGTVDGVFGPRTEAALKAFQSQQGLPATGITNVASWRALLAKLGVVGNAAATSPPASTGNGDPGSTNGGATPAAYPFGGSGSGSAAGGSGTIDGHRVIAVYHMTATAYGPSAADNYPYGPVDYFGQPLQPGMVAVDPSVIPLKSLVYVTGYHDPNLPSGGFLGRAMDTGGAIKGKRIDIYMSAGPQTVSNFGIEPVTVYVLAP